MSPDATSADGSAGGADFDVAGSAPISPVLLAAAAVEPSEFWEAAARGRLAVQQCNDCGRRLGPGRWACTGCRSTDIGWCESTGNGEVHSLTEVHQLYHPEFAALRPYTVGLVDLDDGPRLPSRLLTNDAGTPRIGDRVEVVFVAVDGRTVPAFALQQARAADDGDD